VLSEFGLVAEHLLVLEVAQVSELVQTQLEASNGGVMSDDAVECLSEERQSVFILLLGAEGAVVAGDEVDELALSLGEGCSEEGLA